MQAQLDEYCKYVNTLTLAEVKTLDCGSLTPADFPEQVPAPGARMPLLREVFALVKRYHAWGVKFNVETKVEAGSPTTVDEAHRLGLKVIPWTVDDAPTMNKLIDDGADGVITTRTGCVRCSRSADSTYRGGTVTGRGRSRTPGARWPPRAGPARA